MRRAIFAIGALAFIASAWTDLPVHAEQIRLADNSFLQGEVDETDENGVWFKVTETGGRVYFAWSQLQEDDANRIRNISDPDRDIELAVQITGDRIELLNGTILEGRLEELNGKTKLFNKRYAKGRTIDPEDIADGGLQRGVLIDASVLLGPEEILKEREEKTPPTDAEGFYQLARVAEHYGLYSRAHDLLVEASETTPSKRLQSVIEKRLALMKELIKEQALLLTITEAGNMVEKDQFGNALKLLDRVIQEAKRETIAEKLKEERAKVSKAYTRLVIDSWYDEIDEQLDLWLRDKDNKDATANAGVSFARSTLDAKIAIAIAERCSGDAGDVRKRFLSRLEIAEGETEPLVKSLKDKTASFGSTRWYVVVSGNIPNEGTKKKPGAARNGERERGGRDRDGSTDADEPSFQKKKEDEKGIDDEKIDEIVRRIQEENDRKEAEKNDQPDKDTSGRDKPPPSDVESLADWWSKASRVTRRRWLHAFYVSISPSIRVTRQRDDKLWYR